MNEQECSFDRVQQVIGVLERAINHVAKQANKGYLTPDEQHAVRILRSRIRLLNRIYTSVYGSEPARTIALQELSLQRQDDGSLINLYDRRHSVGRFSCNACENTYESGMPQPRTKLCTKCNSGIAHCCRVPYNENLGINPGLVPVKGDQTVVGAVNVNKLDYNVVFVCDYCGYEELESCG